MGLSWIAGCASPEVMPTGRAVVPDRDGATRIQQSRYGLHPRLAGWQSACARRKENC